MSFNWNLSDDDEEEEDLDVWLKKNDYASGRTKNDDDDETTMATAAASGSAFMFASATKETAQQQQKLAAASFIGSGDYDDDDADDDDDDDDDDEINWEDAEDEEEKEEEDDDDLDKKPAATVTTTTTAAKAPLRPVTIDIGNKNENSKPKQQKKRKRRTKIKPLPQVERFLQNLSRSHLLALTSRAVYLSSLVQDPTLQGMGQSLLPPTLLLWNYLCCCPGSFSTTNNNNNNNNVTNNTTCPTLDDVQELLSWYCEYVSHDRRRAQQRANYAAGAPRQRQRQSLRQRRRTGSGSGCGSNATAAVAGTAKKRKRTKSPSNDDDNDTSTTSNEPSSLLSVSRLVDYAAYWSVSNEEDPQLLLESSSSRDYNTILNKVLLLLAILRSLGWRARLVMQLDPVSSDMTVDHPIFVSSNCTNVFKSIIQSTGGSNKSNKKKKAASSSPTTNKKKKKRKSSAAAAVVTPPESMLEGDGNGGPSSDVGGKTMMWLEVLCQVPKKESRGGKTRSTREQASCMTRRWIHVDPIHQLINQPDQVELLLGKQLVEEEMNNMTAYGSSISSSDNHNSSTNNKNSRRTSSTSRSKRCPIAYAVAVEHHGEEYRLTDVTPRYAESWVATIRLRGMHKNSNNRSKKKRREEEAAVVMHGGGSSSSCWWTRTLHAINNNGLSSTKGAAAASAIKSGTSKEEAIDLDNDAEKSGANEKEAIMLDASSGDDNDEGDGEDPTSKLPAISNHNADEDDVEKQEAEELKQSAVNEAIPTSKAAFKTHPLYVIPSVLGKAQVLAHDAKKRICGVFKGEPVYRRSDVSTALTAKKWLYKRRKVRQSEVGKPIKRVNARKKPIKNNFQPLQSYGVGSQNDGSEEQRARVVAAASAPLDDGMECLYSFWQTDPWSPKYVGPNDPIPVNDYKNIELELLNPGLVHLDQKGLANVAKRLGIPYAPALLGFEGHGGNRTPNIRGIVVHAHNEPLMREASVEVTSHAIEEEHTKRRKAVYRNWKKLMVGLLTKERIEREYGDDDDDEN